MLRHLCIRNIVLVSEAEMAFGPGLNVLSGETGAGKSILLDALALALGARAELRLLRSGESEASVAAEFDIAAQSAAEILLAELDITHDGSCLIRRSLNADGKSRCFVNDQPLSVSGLKRLGETLLEVHGQHDQRELSDVARQLELLDAFAQTSTLRQQVAAHYMAWQRTYQTLQELEQSLAVAQKEQEYFAHMAEELSALNAQPGEAEQLALARREMLQGEKQAQMLQHALELFCGEQPVEVSLASVQRMLLRQANDVMAYEPVIDALERAQNELQTAEQELTQLLESTRYDPQQLERMEERLFAITAAARKYQCEADSLSQSLQEAQAALQQVAQGSEQRANLQQEIQRYRHAYVAAAQQLSERRSKAGQKLARRLHSELVPLKMARCRFQVQQSTLPEAQWSARGIDQIRFEAATNDGQAFAPLHKIASGGELSRFMLALKVVLAQGNACPTMIFDEIDTGTGGAVADAIGARLKTLAQQSQILVVTHLPQVAAQGDRHFHISKQERAGKTFTVISALDSRAREEELARMLAGATITDAARGAARELLEAAG